MSDLPPGFVLDPPRMTGAAMAVTQKPPAAPSAALPEGFVLDGGDDAPSWSQVPLQALKNAPRSAGEFVKALVQPILHPIDTAENLGKLGSSVLRWATPTPEIQKNPEDLAPAKAVGNFFADRYGSEPGIRKTLATDPVGVAADLATVLMGGSALPTRAAPMLAKAASIVDPLTQAGNVVKGVGKVGEVLGSNALGMTTGAGTQSIRTAAAAGREGGEIGQAFTENMRGAPVKDVVEQAKTAVDQLRQERSEAYRTGKAEVARETTPLAFDDIDKAVKSAADVGTFRGQSGTAPAVTIEPAAAEVVGRMEGIVKAWKALDPAEYHTPVGIDGLKRALGNLRDSTGPHTPERVAADRIYRAVRDEIGKQVPAYADVMKDYGRASDAIDEVSRTLSVTDKATTDTTARKLLSATRNNVQTNYGERSRLLDLLAEKTPTLPASIAGQALSALPPRGLVARGGIGAAAGAGLLSNPWALASIPAFSPRVVGEGAYLGGRAAGGIDKLAEALRINAPNVRGAEQGAFQSGRLSEQEKRRLLAQALMRANEQGAR